MGQVVKTHFIHTLAVVLATSVRSCPGSLLWTGWCGVFAPRLRDSIPDDVTAGAFSARKREQSFYRGLMGPSLRSALQGGIAYPGGLGPEGPDQKFNGCSPL